MAIRDYRKAVPIPEPYGKETPTQLDLENAIVHVQRAITKIAGYMKNKFLDHINHVPQLILARGAQKIRICLSDSRLLACIDRITSKRLTFHGLSPEN
ncbi:hypothetical protein ACTXT7_012175 [Hymenolepis weldensis]